MSWKTFRPFALLIGLALAGCAPPPQPQATASACPAVFRPGLTPKWMTCADGKANINWPPNDGFAATPISQTLALGQMIDRFGSQNGNFFSPKGETYASRAVPYVCQKMDYRVYEVLKPITVKAGKATPWFDEPGDATQYETTAPAAKLVSDRDLAVITDSPAGSAPAPQCGTP